MRQHPGWLCRAVFLCLHILFLAATSNLVKTIESGKAVDVISAQIEKRQKEKAGLEVELAKEKMLRPTLSFEDVRYFFEKFKNGYANDFAFRSALVNTFIGKILIYDGDDARVEIYCNASENSLNVPIGEPLMGSPMAQLARPARLERATFRVGV